MSGENAEVIRGAVEAWNAADMDRLRTFYDPDVVVARYRWKAEGHGPPMSMELTYVNTVRNGRLVEIEMFWDHDTALEAVGLSE